MSADRERVGILGGAFNPPHHGHVICAQEARIGLGLDRVLLVPVGEPPHRDLSSDSDAGREHRLAMTRLAALGQPGVEVSTVEIDREGASYSVDTLAMLAEMEPEAQFVLIVGADQAAAFGGWHRPDRIGELAQIAVAGRAGQDHDQAIGEVERHSGAAPALSFEMPRIDISSTLVRAMASRGQTVAHLVPAGVAELIEEAGLYR